MSDDDKTIFCFLGGRHVELPLSSYDHLMRQLFALAEDRDAALAERDEWQGLEEKEAEALAFVQAEKADLRAQLAAVTVENVCDACAGAGVPISGGLCMCHGTGKMSDAAYWLRRELVDSQAENARLRAAIAPTPENVAFLVREFAGISSAFAARFLAAIAARAGVKLLTLAHLYPGEGPDGEFAYSNPDICRACGAMLLPENKTIADGCGCNSARGINHGLVAKNTCTCLACDPAQSGSSRVKATSDDWGNGLPEVRRTVSYSPGPCPFCGREPRVLGQERGQPDKFWTISCFGEGHVSHAWAHGETLEAAAKVWNTRVPLPAENTERDELLAMLRIYHPACPPSDHACMACALIARIKGGK